MNRKRRSSDESPPGRVRSARRALPGGPTRGPPPGPPARPPKRSDATEPGHPAEAERRLGRHRARKRPSATGHEPWTDRAPPTWTGAQRPRPRRGRLPAAPEAKRKAPPGTRPVQRVPAPRRAREDLPREAEAPLGREARAAAPRHPEVREDLPREAETPLGRKARAAAPRHPEGRGFDVRRRERLTGTTDPGASPGSGGAGAHPQRSVTVASEPELRGAGTRLAPPTPRSLAAREGPGPAGPHPEAETSRNVPSGWASGGSRPTARPRGRSMPPDRS